MWNRIYHPVLNALQSMKAMLANEKVSDNMAKQLEMQQATEKFKTVKPMEIKDQQNVFVPFLPKTFVGERQTMHDVTKHRAENYITRTNGRCNKPGAVVSIEDDEGKERLGFVAKAEHSNKKRTEICYCEDSNENCLLSGWVDTNHLLTAPEKGAETGASRAPGFDPSAHLSARPPSPARMD